MRKIINSTYITLDGVIEGPHLWPSLGRPSDERAGQIQTDLALSCDALLFVAGPAVGFDLTDTTTLSDGSAIVSYQTAKTLPRAA
jgi:hypothetical protein